MKSLVFIFFSSHFPLQYRTNKKCLEGACCPHVIRKRAATPAAPMLPVLLLTGQPSLRFESLNFNSIAQISNVELQLYFYHHHLVLSAPSWSSLMDLHFLQSCVILTHSLYFILIHSMMLSAHLSHCLPLLRFPLIFPSSSSLWMSSLLTMCPE